MIGGVDPVGVGFALAERVGCALDLHTVRTRQFDAVVMYHSVREPEAVRPDTSDITVGELRRHLEYFTSECTVVDLPAVGGPGAWPRPSGWRSGADTARSAGEKRVALTFDDGYREFYEHVRPLLREFDVPATVFVIPGFLDSANRREQVMNTGHLFDALTSEQVADLAADPLVTVGNHTRTHHNVGAHHERDIIETEVLGAQRDLQERFDAAADRFCYPNGGHNETSRAVVRESHDLATADESMRPVLAGEDRVTLPRVDGGVDFERVRWRLSDLNGELLSLTRRLVGTP